LTRWEVVFKEFVAPRANQRAQKLLKFNHARKLVVLPDG